MGNGLRTFSVTASERVERPPVANALSHRWAMPSTVEFVIHAKAVFVRMHNSRAHTRVVFIFVGCIQSLVLRDLGAYTMEFDLRNWETPLEKR